MKKTTFAILAAFSIILAALMLAYPDILVNPGPLMGGHRHLTRSCLSCHIPFRGVRAEQCVGCHRPETIGLLTVSGRPLNRNTPGSTLHRGLPAGSCTECHTDHKGADARKAIRAFRHEAISSSLRNNCNACHERQKPADALHRSVTGRCAQCHDTEKWSSVLFNHGMLEAGQSANCVTCHRDDRPGDEIHRSQSGCGECHGTNRWKPATFDHTKVSASGKQCVSCHGQDRPSDNLHRVSQTGCGECHATNRWKPATFDHTKVSASGKQCVSCHGKDQPSDELHRVSRAGCGTCHGTNRWTPATFDHNRYFPLQGEHRASCRTCHTDPADYRKYTCYGCHEHSPSRIAAEHREEGIGNYQNCIRCHRSGSGEDRGEHRGGQRKGHGDDD
ncbi:MAG: hypothetical protein HGB04_04430 [Chlorobiaceae bacterium]|nr:hypothetical protein [Chlorobiaceae bacterium]